MTNDDRFADTPDWKWRATVTTEGGQEHDITRELAVMYDAIVGSMDWGSGFLDVEDVTAMLRIGGLCGFEAGEYEREHGTPVLLDRDGEPMTTLAERYGRTVAAKGWGEDVYTPRGHMVRASNVIPNRDGEVAAIRLLGFGGEERGTYPLTEPVRVHAGRSVTLEAPVADE